MRNEKGTWYPFIIMNADRSDKKRYALVEFSWPSSKKNFFFSTNKEENERKIDFIDEKQIKIGEYKKKKKKNSVLRLSTMTLDECKVFMWFQQKNFFRKKNCCMIPTFVNHINLLKIGGFWQVYGNVTKL